MKNIIPNKNKKVITSYKLYYDEKCPLCLKTKSYIDRWLKPINTIYISISSSNLVLFCEDDIRVDPKWIESHLYCIEKYTEVNIQGTAIMLDILANTKHNVKKIVVASSRSIYGEGKYMHQKLGAVYPSHRSEHEMLYGTVFVL